VLEPTPQSPPRLPPPGGERPPHAFLLDQVRTLQRRALWAQGALLGVATGLALLVAGGLVFASVPTLGRVLCWAAAPAALAVLLAFGLWLAGRRVGDDARTARLLAETIPELDFDVLAAVELSRALGQRHDFSPDLARAFLKQVGERARRADARAVVDPQDLRRAWAGFFTVAFAALALAAWKGPRLSQGVQLAFARQAVAELALRREPITGDFSLTYRYPEYTGLQPRTVTGTSGEVTAPRGTEVKVETRADRDVDGAALQVNGTRVPLQRSGTRDLAGSFIVDAPGAYHVVFLDGDKVVARGPDLPLTVEPDLAPVVKLSSPEDQLEVDADEQKLSLKYDVSDDYGLTSLELVFRTASGDEQRLPLSHDTGRSSQGTYGWDISGLKLGPGQWVQYYVEAKDNDAPAGKKAGVSRTQSFKLYSASEHRRAALEKAEALWERLVELLADRLEGRDRKLEKSPEELAAGRAIDERGEALAQDLTQTAAELLKDKDAPAELLTALANVGTELRSKVRGTRDARMLVERMAMRNAKVPDLGPRLVTMVTREIETEEKSVLYLETLLDLQRVAALKELAEELRSRRRELSGLLEDFKNAPDQKKQEELLRHMEGLKDRINELMQRMGEMAKGIRDEYLNYEALKELQESRDLKSSLEEVEQLVKEGKTDEAMKKMQELAMQMDEMLEQLDEAADQSEEQADPELAKKFEDFKQGLDEAAAEQERLAQQTRAVREKYREQTRKRVAEKGKALADELLKKTAELRKSWEAETESTQGLAGEGLKEQALHELDNLDQALKAQDYDLALEAARGTSDRALALQEVAERNRRLDETFSNPPEVRKGSKDVADRAARDARKAEEVREKLEQIFPRPDELLSQDDQKKLQELSGQQQKLERKAQKLQGQMDELSQMAPIFDPDAQRQLDQAGQRMGQAAGELARKDAREANGEQNAALEHLQSLQRQMEQAQQGGGKGKRRLPLPMSMGQRGGRGLKQDKVEIPDEDPNRAPRELRKDVMDAMKQGSPDRYKDQVKKYYEELVK
jgi:Domain of unknown function (DUF4175)